jgi:hypothetical protein
MSREQRLGVCDQERARKAAMTVPEREAEHYEIACRLAVVRGDPQPDRETHRQAFYERAGYQPDPEPEQDEQPDHPDPGDAH